MAQPINLYEDAIKALDSLYKEEKCWQATVINLPVATSITDDTLQIINLASTLGKASRRSKKIDDDTCYFLPKDKYSVNNEVFRKKMLGPLFVFHCREAGFSVVMKGWEGPLSKTIFFCNRGKEYQLNKATEGTVPSTNGKKRSKREATSRRPMPGDDEKCPFRFAVFWSDELKRWYLPKQQSGDLCREGHAQRAPDQVRVRIDSLGDQERILQEQMVKIQQRPGGVARLTYERTGIDVEPYQVSHLRKQMRGQQVLANARIVYGQDFDTSGMVTTVADNLLLALQARTDASFVAIFAAFDTNDLRIRSKKRRSDGLIEETEIPIDQLSDPVDSAERFSMKVRDSLSITGSGLILLANCMDI